MGQTVLTLTQISWKYLKQKKTGGFVRNLFRLLKGQYGTNRNICNIFWRLIKMLWKDNMDQTIVFHDFFVISQLLKTG